MSKNDAKWNDLSAKYFTEFVHMVSDITLDKVFYPVAEVTSENDLFGSFSPPYFPQPYRHPLHPDFKPPMEMAGKGLLGLYSPEPRLIDYETERINQAGRIAKHWQAIKSNKVFQLLNEDANFKKAKAVFEKKRKGANPGDQYDQYAHAYAEFRLYEATASTVGLFLITSGKAFNWPVPDKKKTKKARGHAWTLLDAFDKDGVALHDSAKQSTLKVLLDELAGQLDVQVKTGRAEWGGANRPYRVLIESLANSLRRHFGEVSPEIGKSLLGMISCPFGEKTIESQLKNLTGKNSSKTG